MTLLERIRKILKQQPCKRCQDLQRQLALWQELCKRYGETDLSIQNLKQAHEYRVKNGG